MKTLDTQLEEQGFELIEDNTDALNYGITVYEKIEGDELTQVTIQTEKIDK